MPRVLFAYSFHYEKCYDARRLLAPSVCFAIRYSFHGISSVSPILSNSIFEMLAWRSIYFYLILFRAQGWYLMMAQLLSPSSHSWIIISFLNNAFYNHFSPGHSLPASSVKHIWWLYEIACIVSWHKRIYSHFDINAHIKNIGRAAFDITENVFHNVFIYNGWYDRAMKRI